VIDIDLQRDADVIEARCRASLSADVSARARDEGAAMDAMTAADWALRAWEESGIRSSP